ncbi:MAG: glycosyltransferase [Pirellulales bacterium]|nr:glycosyltransferase [Pirellulales bacterium]
MLKTPLRRDTLLKDISNRANLTVVDPWQVGLPILSPSERRLSPESAHGILRELDATISPHTIIIRDDDLALLVVDDAELRSRCWIYFCNIHTQLRKKIEAKSSKFLRIDCLLSQTKRVRDLLNQCLSPAGHDRIIELPPMIPDFSHSQPRHLEPQIPKLVYSGKFAPHYMTLEMIEAFREIRREIPKAEFMVLGDKFHNSPPVPGFEELVKDGLNKTDGIRWYGGVSRWDALRVMEQSDIGSCWRHESFDSSLEISTKALEYASLGLPVLLNPSPSHQDVFGSDYPGFVSTEQDFVRTFIRLATDSKLYESLSSQSLDLAQEFTFTSTSEKILSNLTLHRPFVSPRSASRQVRILVAGHKLNFVDPLINHWKSTNYAEVQIDEWLGHSQHDERVSQSLLDWADIVFCEWCLGNAVWYSNRIRPEQKLIIRLHHQEMDLPYLDQLRWDNVKSLITICDAHFHELSNRYLDHQDKISLIYNLFDTGSFMQPKRRRAGFNLGFVGMVPQRKWPHLAVDILSKLHRYDSRYRLYILGHPPSAYPWMKSRTTELKYYQELEDRIESGPEKHAVIRDAFTEDVPAWFSKIGFLLSTSEHEGSHQAVAEGMASGAIPIIRNWNGADQMYPECFVYRDIDEAVQMVLAFGSNDRYDQLSQYCVAFASEHFDVESVWSQLRKIIES